MIFLYAALLAFLIPISLAQISDDFEKGWDKTAWPIYTFQCQQGDANVTLDTSVAHSGKNSMRVDGEGGFCGHMFFGTSKIPSGDIYVRVWLQASKPVTENHITFISMVDTSQGDGKHLRIGVQLQVLAFNREKDDVNLPDLSPYGMNKTIPLPTGSWECLEYHLGPDGTIETWFNSVAIEGMTSIAGKVNKEVDDQWQGPGLIPKITSINFGWESFGSEPNTYWYDDIVIGGTRVGCT